MKTRIEMTKSFLLDTIANTRDKISLLKTSSDPLNTGFDNLGLDPDKDAIILFNDKMYFVDKQEKKVTEIPEYPGNKNIMVANFKKTLNNLELNKCREATKEECDLIYSPIECDFSNKAWLEERWIQALSTPIMRILERIGYLRDMEVYLCKLKELPTIDNMKNYKNTYLFCETPEKKLYYIKLDAGKPMTKGPPIFKLIQVDINKFEDEFESITKNLNNTKVKISSKEIQELLEKSGYKNKFLPHESYSLVANSDTAAELLMEDPTKVVTVCEKYLNDKDPDKNQTKDVRNSLSRIQSNCQDFINTIMDDLKVLREFHFIYCQEKDDKFYQRCSEAILLPIVMSFSAVGKWPLTPETTDQTDQDAIEKIKKLGLLFMRLKKIAEDHGQYQKKSTDLEQENDTLMLAKEKSELYNKFLPINDTMSIEIINCLLEIGECMANKKEVQIQIRSDDLKVRDICQLEPSEIIKLGNFCVGFGKDSIFKECALILSTKPDVTIKEVIAETLRLPIVQPSPTLSNEPPSQAPH